MRKVDTVWVRNDGNEVFTSRYDGEDFTIAPGKAEEITLACAELVFDFGKDDRSNCLRRLGWLHMNAKMDQALARLNKFSFHMENPKYAKHEKTADFAPGGEGEGGGDGKPPPPPAAGPLSRLHRAAAAA